jgi:DnaK suppressor protein
MSLDLESIKDALEVRRQALQAELERLMKPPEQGASVSFGKRVGDGTTEAVERIAGTATARSLAASIADIDAALARIELGDYGICQRCGVLISALRLEALPASTLCVDCASQ